MSSREIFALLNEAKTEKGKYIALKGAINTLISSIEGAKNSFMAASDALETGLTIDGIPADKGKTIDFANELAGIICALNGVLELIPPELTKLDEKIEQLEGSYYNALAREREAAERRRQQLMENQLNARQSNMLK